MNIIHSAKVLIGSPGNVILIAKLSNIRKSSNIRLKYLMQGVNNQTIILIDRLRRYVEGNLCPVTFHRFVHLNISQSILTFTYNKL